MREKLIFIKHNDSSFIMVDQQILESRYRVVPYCYKGGGSRFSFFFRMLRMSLFLIRHIRGTRALVTWFGDYHAAILTLTGMLFKKKVIIFAGGQEAIAYPELKKGVFTRKWRGRFVSFALRHASLVIPNHASLLYHRNFYYTPEGKVDGILHYIPGFRTPVEILPNGIDTAKFYRDPSIPKEEGTVLAAGTMGSTADFINKGFDLFTEMARRNSDLRFTMIGINRDFLPWIESNYKISTIPNLRLIFFTRDLRLLFEEYNRARVFVQASITEGMPNTLSEAMLCECIPVGSNVNGIPDAMGGTGVIVMHRGMDALEAAVRKALTLDTGVIAARYVRDHFTVGLRKEGLLRIFDKVL